MLIGFDAKRIVRNATGLGSYSRTLVNSLSAADADTQFMLYAPEEGRIELRTQIVERPNVGFSFFSTLSPLAARLPMAKALWRSHGIVKCLQHDGVDLFHGLSGELPRGLRKAGIPALVTIHDLIFLRHPEYYNPIDVALYRRKFHASLREAQRIVAISECTKRDILAFSDYPAERIDVIYQSCGTRFRQHATDEEKQEVARLYHLPQRFVLSVGTIEPRKNALLAIQALLNPLLADLHLVLVGRPTSYVRNKLQPFIMQNGLVERVHFLSGVPNQHLPAIYQQALCFVYPSRYEGFGIPIIEAIQSRLPVVAATGSCLEEAGGPDSLYVSPDDAQALAQAIAASLLGATGREKRVERSLHYIERFENSDIAQQMLDKYHQLMKEQ